MGSNEIVGLLGPNGAGKTTTINMILGVLEPGAGTIRIEGVEIAENRSRALERTNFAAVFYPVSALPGWMQKVSLLLPPAHVFEGVRSIVEGRQFLGTALIWSALLSTPYILLASWFFTRVHRNVVRSGLLARYSAESVT